jgi:hypothetical protein
MAVTTSYLNQSPKIEISDLYLSIGPDDHGEAPV